LVVTGNDWKIREACQLNGNIFNQPEGIAFDTAGNLYISNEGDDLTQGNILKFARSD
jgi:secreted PhoX family phosphatase